ncbi:hypothetical protein MNV49_007344 [Pseudohyphozyma bogoriensis]|nr:hypothetical protein MNV49_007344 [Pseudohyphozyma bogoriensis]
MLSLRLLPSSLVFALLTFTTPLVHAQKCTGDYTLSTKTDSVTLLPTYSCCRVDARGEQLCDGEIVYPSHLSKRVRRAKRALLEERHQANLALKPAARTCADNLNACDLPTGGFECISFEELTSCGGCVEGGVGINCLTLDLTGYAGVGCFEGQCVALSCSKDYKLRHGACVPAYF